jgi:hypothetical protein
MTIFDSDGNLGVIFIADNAGLNISSTNRSTKFINE